MIRQFTGAVSVCAVDHTVLRLSERHRVSWRRSRAGPRVAPRVVRRRAKMTKAVEEAVRECGMGLNPFTEGSGQVNVPVPKATKESRNALVKVASKHTEKVRARGTRESKSSASAKGRGRSPGHPSLASHQDTGGRPEYRG